MLLYHPAFDIYHAIFRILRILESLPKQSIEIERLRIYDFYVLFPGELYKFRFPTALVKEKRRFRSNNCYQIINDPKRLFFRLEPYQHCALKTLAARQFIDANLFLEGKVIRSDKELPRGLDTAIKTANEKPDSVINLLTGPFLNLDLYGNSGLKGRSDLFEYRYDFKGATVSS
jgi:hypothetical protein